MTDDDRRSVAISVMMTQELLEHAAFDVSRRAMLELIGKVDADLLSEGRQRAGSGTFLITFEAESERIDGDPVTPPQRPR